MKKSDSVKQIARFIGQIFFVPLFCIYGFVLIGCRGTPSQDPPIYLIRNMNDQTSFGPQSKNDFFSDKLSARKPPAGTVAQGEEGLVPHDFAALQAPKTPSDLRRDQIKAMKENKYPLTPAFLKLGEKNYGIYCTPCHGVSGRANGLVTQAANGAIRPPSFHEERLLALSVGEVYDAVSYGFNNGNMPPFSHALNEEERWAVAAYVRALQLKLMKDKLGSSNDIKPGPKEDKSTGIKADTVTSTNKVDSKKQDK